MSGTVATYVTHALTYFGLGFYVGFVLGITIPLPRNAFRHRHPEKDMPLMYRPHLPRAQLVQTITVVLVMVAMLLTGLTWMRTGIANREQAQNTCRILKATTSTLRDRSTANVAQTNALRNALLSVRDELDVGMPGPKPPTTATIDRYLAAQAAYLKSLQDNTYPTPTTLKAC